MPFLAARLRLRSCRWPLLGGSCVDSDQSESFPSCPAFRLLARHSLRVSSSMRSPFPRPVLARAEAAEVPTGLGVTSDGTCASSRGTACAPPSPSSWALAEHKHCKPAWFHLGLRRCRYSLA